MSRSPVIHSRYRLFGRGRNFGIRSDPEAISLQYLLSPSPVTLEHIIEAHLTMIFRENRSRGVIRLSASLFMRDDRLSRSCATLSTASLLSLLYQEKV